MSALPVLLLAQLVVEEQAFALVVIRLHRLLTLNMELFRVKQLVLMANMHPLLPISVHLVTLIALPAAVAPRTVLLADFHFHQAYHFTFQVIHV